VPRSLLLPAVVALALTGGAGAAGTAPAKPQGLILYWSTDPIPSLWSIRPDGSGRHRFLRNRQNGKRPRLSPDRAWVVFDGTPPGKPPLSEFRVQLVRLDGTGRRTLTHSDDWEIDAQWLPDKSRIGFVRRPPDDWTKGEILTIRPDGTDEQHLLNGTAARWSPDGARVAYGAPTADSDSDLFVANADGSDPTRLTTSRPIESPDAWSPDGKRLLFTRYREGTAADVYVMDADGTHVKRLPRAGTDQSGSWSPDGRTIVFTSRRAGIPQLYLMNADGTHQRVLSRTAFTAFDPSWR
jgi:Tol biopolymer transport system component